jgi:hypothetical protein
MPNPSSQKPAPLSTPKFEPLLESELPTRNEIVEGLIREGDLVALSGPYFTGKTPLLCQLALSVATGVEWLGHGVDSRRVTVLDFESSPVGWRETAAAICDRLDVPLPGSAELDIRCDRRHPILPSDAGRMTQPRIEFLETLMRRKPSGVVIVDPFDGLFEGTDKNKSVEVTAVYKALRGLLREYPRAALILIFGLRKRTRPAHELSNLLLDPRGWLEETSGCAEVMTRADVRIGMDRYGEDDGPTRLIHGVGRARTVEPIFIKELDDPAQGFELLGRGETLGATFGERDLQWWLSLPDRFRWRDAAAIQVEDKTICRATLTRILKLGGAARLLRKHGNYYQKTK